MRRFHQRFYQQTISLGALWLLLAFCNAELMLHFVSPSVLAHNRCRPGCGPVCCCARNMTRPACGATATSWDSSDPVCEVANVAATAIIMDLKAVPLSPYQNAESAKVTTLALASSLVFCVNFSLEPPDPPPRCEHA